MYECEAAELSLDWPQTILINFVDPKNFPTSSPKLLSEATTPGSLLLNTPINKLALLFTLFN